MLRDTPATRGTRVHLAFLPPLPADNSSTWNLMIKIDLDSMGAAA